MDTKEFNKKIQVMISSIKEGKESDLMEHKDLIIELSNYCKQRSFFKKNEEKSRSFCKDMNLEETYYHMIYKIAKSPFKLFADGVAIMLIPIVEEKLIEVKSQFIPIIN